ncbi:B-cadherin [Chanos chanos]|uniref:Cadherin-1 n=1 Tax=Chanos chanos TaxID=29144 RepID=A0A6J2WL86_CHACN|nr:B-cadherin-like [Chanos chanos]
MGSQVCWAFLTLLLRCAICAAVTRSKADESLLLLQTHGRDNSDSYGQAAGRFPVLVFPLFFGGEIRRKRDWVIPPISFPENDRGPFPKSVVQLRSSVAKEIAIIYKITGPGADQPPEGVFTVDKRSGMLYVTKPLDREKIPEYRLRAHAIASGHDSVEQPMDIIIKVIDQNDNRPVCPPNPFRGSVTENARPDVSVLQVRAEDLDDPNTDNGVVQYRLLKQEPGLPNAEMFTVNPVSGLISVNSVGLDRETQPQYKLLIEAADMDGAGQSTTCTASITVTDINDHAPKFSHNSYTGSVEENKVGEVVVRLPVTDLDAASTVYSATKYTIVRGNENKLFNISTGPSRMEGVITTAKGLDFERSGRLSLVVVVENEAPFAVPLTTSSATVFVNVEDLNEAPIFLPGQKRISVPEDLSVGTPITQYTAKDPDTARQQTIRYKLWEEFSGWLMVERDTGVVKVRSPMDRESSHVKDGTYTAFVLAYDDDFKPGTGTGTLVIEVEDVNDNAPVLDQRAVLFCSTDPEPVTLTISDADGPHNAGPFSAELQRDARSNWTITTNSTMGSVVMRPRKRLPADVYSVLLRVYDAGRLFQDSSLSVEVCECRGVASAQACLSPRSQPHATDSATLSVAVLGAVFGLLLFLLLLLLFIKRKRGGRKEVLLQEEDVRDNIYYYNEEGGGEEDQDYDLSQLHLGLDNRPEVLCADVAPTLSPAVQYRLHPEENEEISSFIKDNLNAADRDPSAPPYDSLLVFDYEGAGSEVGSLSSLQSGSSDGNQDYHYLNQWGVPFRKLADMYGGGEDDCDSDILPGKTEWV